ncbi:MAG TPA: PQQ-binding-like beta-propeller repeat protein [Gemmatimonadaceae bacterium]|nr:PQQ-binding-like beta-propeller repeat protein [Gemmatimonadaceae bacterium]
MLKASSRNAVPVDGWPLAPTGSIRTVIACFPTVSARAWSIGTAAKFTRPSVAGARVYVGTRDNHVVALGALGAQSAV